MFVEPIKPNPITFGIYLGCKRTGYGDCIYGKYKGYNIEVYTSKRDNAKLHYISDGKNNWLRSKLTYVLDNVKKVIKSKRVEKGDNYAL